MHIVKWPHISMYSDPSFFFGSYALNFSDLWAGANPSFECEGHLNRRFMLVVGQSTALCYHRLSNGMQEYKD